jgi:putative pyruvate formate lyase activating enzyme
VYNISFVTASHHVRTVCEALSGLRLGIPVVWNSSGYERVETLRMLEGLVQVYLPDLKYLRTDPAKKYSFAPDYPSVVKEAVREMFRQTGRYVMDEEGILQRGVLIRHLILPGQEQNTMDCIDFAAEAFPEDSVLFSLMSQYTPPSGLESYPELARPVGTELSGWMNDYLLRSGIRNGYTQDPASATEELLPAFDGTGV